MTLTETLDSLKYNNDGLIPAIAQQFEILILPIHRRIHVVGNPTHQLATIRRYRACLVKKDK